MTTKKIDREKGWTPVSRPGGIYCSPLCGCGCLKKDYSDAVNHADALALRMGPGWVPRVWENGGWNYMVSKGIFEIRPAAFRPEQRGYTAWVQSRPQFISQLGSDPRALLEEQIQQARDYFELQLAGVSVES